MSNKTENLTVPQGDYGSNLDFTLLDSEGEARKDLEGKTPMLKLWSPGKPNSVILEGECDYDEVLTHVCHYFIIQGDFDTVGRYLYEIELVTETSVESALSGWLTVVESPFTAVEES